MYYHSDSSVFEDEDSSVCGVVYITSEGGAFHPKPSQNKVLQHQQQAQPHADKGQDKRSSKRLLIGVACAVGVVVLLALSIGIAVGAPINVLPLLLYNSCC
jgi:hypothetical protein